MNRRRFLRMLSAAPVVVPGAAFAAVVGAADEKMSVPSVKAELCPAVRREFSAAAIRDEEEAKEWPCVTVHNFTFGDVELEIRRDLVNVTVRPHQGKTWRITRVVRPRFLG